MKFRTMIKMIMPYGLYNYIINHRYNHHYSVNKLFDLDLTTADIEQSNKLPNQIVSVQGFGYSGSGAVVDIMREYYGNVVWGGYELQNTPEKSWSEIKQSACKEIDILRLSGGILELEKYITEQNVFIKDAALRRFIDLVNSWMRVQPHNSLLLTNEFQIRIKTFLDSLIDFKIDVGNRNPYNNHLYTNSDTPKNYIFFLKDLTVSEFQNNAKKFLESIFKIAGNAEILILDQFCMDFKSDLDILSKYVDNLKIIQVSRDPRDVYMTAILEHVKWIPTSSIEDFVKWFKVCHKCMEGWEESENMLILRFEDVVYDYNRTLKKIQKFLGLSDSKHSRKLSFFDPAISKKNIGLWERANGDEKLFVDAIYKALPEFCYGM